MYHFQTFVLGIFPYRLHGHRGRSVTHLMDDPIVPDELALAAAREAGLPYFRGGIVEHGGAGHRSWRRSYSPSGRAPPDGDARVDDARPHGRVHDAGRGPAPGAPTASTSTRTSRTSAGFPAGRVTYAPHRHEIVCAEHWAPRLEAVMRDAGAERHVLGDVATDARARWPTAPGRGPARRSRATSWGRRAHGRRPGARASSTRGSASTGRRQRRRAPTRRCSRRRPATARRSRS